MELLTFNLFYYCNKTLEHLDMSGVGIGSEEANLISGSIAKANS